MVGFRHVQGVAGGNGAARKIALAPTPSFAVIPARDMSERGTGRLEPACPQPGGWREEAVGPKGEEALSQANAGARTERVLSSSQSARAFAPAVSAPHVA